MWHGCSFDSCLSNCMAWQTDWPKWMVLLQGGTWITGSLWSRANPLTISHSSPQHPSLVLSSRSCFVQWGAEVWVCRSLNSDSLSCLRRRAKCTTTLPSSSTTWATASPWWPSWWPLSSFCVSGEKAQALLPVSPWAPEHARLRQRRYRRSSSMRVLTKGVTASRLSTRE